MNTGNLCDRLAAALVPPSRRWSVIDGEALDLKHFAEVGLPGEGFVLTSATGKLKVTIEEEK